MSFSATNGYTPRTFDEIIAAFVTLINTSFGTTYTAESIVGSNFYKYFYASAQLILANEIEFAEAYLKLQDYIRQINAKISQPVVTSDGIVDYFHTEGYEASVAQASDGSAGYVFVCLNLDSDDSTYSDDKDACLELLKNCIVGGARCVGDETGEVTLSNGQSFEFAFALPTITETLLRVEIEVSRNTNIVAETQSEIAAIVFDKMNEVQDNGKKLYSLGLDFEPDKYATPEMFPYASRIVTTYSTNSGSSYVGTVFEAAYDDLLNIPLENIEVILS
jgi:hypothetical protein